MYPTLRIFYEKNTKPFHQHPLLIRRWIERMERQACDLGYVVYRPYP